MRWSRLSGLKKGRLPTTIPFLKNNEFDYSWLLPDSMKDYTWIVFHLSDNNHSCKCI